MVVVSIQMETQLKLLQLGQLVAPKGQVLAIAFILSAYSQELTTDSEVEFRTGNSTGTERKSIWVQPQCDTVVEFTARF